MNRQRWTDEEVFYLVSNYNKIDYAEIANHLGKTLSAIHKKLNYMGLKLQDKERSKRRASVMSILSNNQNKELNPNWKGGISTNNYHYKKLQIERYPEKVMARKMVAREIRSGRLKRLPCEICGTVQSFAHHDDYSKPLMVRWLCRKHHRDFHDGLH